MEREVRHEPAAHLPAGVCRCCLASGWPGALTRRNAIVVLMGIELMLNAANLNFIAFWRYGPDPARLDGVMFAVFAIGVAAAEAAVGLALVIAVLSPFADGPRWTNWSTQLRG
jgi:NADH:ubiquinone oxidoreductase subunit K